MEHLLREFTVEWILSFLLVFCRVGSALVLMPGIGEAYVSVRIRLLLAFAVSLILMPLIVSSLPTRVPPSVVELLMWMMPEIMVGIAIGGMARLALSALHLTGMMISYQSGLSSALLFDPNSGTQSSAIGNLYTLIGVVLLFETNVHHLFIKGIAGSYQLFHFGHWFSVVDMGQMATQMMSDTFLIAMQLAAPFIVMGIVFFLGAGILARLMPNMNIFFVTVPLQVMLGFFIMMATFSGAMSWWIERYQDTMTSFLNGSYEARD